MIFFSLCWCFYIKNHITFVTILVYKLIILFTAYTYIYYDYSLNTTFYYLIYLILLFYIDIWTNGLLVKGSNYSLVYYSDYLQLFMLLLCRFHRIIPENVYSQNEWESKCWRSDARVRSIYEPRGGECGGANPLVGAHAFGTALAYCYRHRCACCNLNDYSYIASYYSGVLMTYALFNNLCGRQN